MGAAISLSTFAAMSGTAVAQDQPSAAAAAPEEIVVTGSRIRTSDVTAANPLTVVTAEQLQQTEAINLQQYFQKLPDVDFSGAETTNNNNGGGGNTQVSLRNLGPNRTLVLLNGQRFPYTDNQNNQSIDAVDTNNIPFSMIDHIEILRDGASSIYGADAIGGVVNVITKKNFTGVEVGGSVGETSYNDGLRYQTYVNTGIGNDRGNILINLSHDYQDPISQGARAWAVTQHPEADYNSYDNISSRVTGAVGIVGGTKYYFPSGPNSAIKNSKAYTLGSPIDSEGIAYGGGGLTPGDIAIPGAGVFFNFLPTQGLVSGFSRTQANFTGHYDLTPGVTLVMEGFYTNRQSNEFLNPEPTGYNTPTPQFPNGFYVPYQIAGGGVNPYFPTALYTSVTGAAPTATSQIPVLTRRFENGPRFYTDDVNTYRFRIGLEGSFSDYDWQVGYLYGKSAAQYNVQNEANFYHLSQILGMNPCGSAPGCSVGDIFGYNTLTPAQAKYLIFTNTDTSAYAMQDAYGSISGPVPFVPELPGGPIKAAAGFEMRSESLFDHPDSIVSQGDGAIFTTPTQGHYETYSVYAELQLPILKDMPFVKSLDADLSARYDYNNLFGRALTHKIGVNWAINDDIRLRGANSTGFRAPQLKELYEGLSQGEIGGTDPCSPGGTYAGSAACLSAIAAAGANPASVDKINQVTEATGGNPALHPEVSQEWTAGIVLTPTAIKGLAVTMDYYTILIRNEIGNLDANSLINACYGGVPYLVSQSQACTLVGPRLQGTGALGVVQALNANVGAENTDGIDVTAAYTFGADQIGLPFDGSFQINGQANYLIHDNIYSGGVVVQQAGTFDLQGGDSAEPRWKALLALTYAEDNWSINWTSRYYGGLKNVDTTSYCDPAGVVCPAVGAGDYQGNESAGVFYHDISFTYTMEPATVTVGVDNLFDKDPPFLFPTGQSNAPGAAGFDFVGRFIYMKFTAKFGGEEAPPPMAAPYTPPAAVAPTPVAKSYMVFFDFNKSDLTPQAVTIVDTAAKNAGTAHVTQLTVTGHTDTVGSDAYNMRLSKRRAESVAAELEKDGIPSSEIEIVAKGKRDLLVPTKDGVKEPQNRRVQIVYDNGMTS